MSLGRRGTLPSYSRKFNHLANPSPSAFFIPSYLQNSRYMSRLETENKARIARERQQPTGSLSNAPSLSSSANATNIHRLAPSHRGMTYDVIESNPPKEEDQLMPLPSRWSDQDKYPGLDITNGGLDVRYSGAASKADIEAASVRADYPMSPACGIYYFEVTVNSKTKDSAIAIGFSTAEASLERLPGWETHSWGYHGDDGKMFSGEHSGRSYGPTFSANDVVGCGINFNTGQAFFTLNGRDLEVCFRDLREIRPYPTVGMKKYSGASVSVNFGQRPFVFDINEKMNREERQIYAEISRHKADKLVPGLNEDSLIHKLVLQYLSHDGYVETAAAFAQEVNKEKQALDTAQPGSGIQVPAADTTEAVYRQGKVIIDKRDEY
jgi:Ran-binding protein 9/10